MSAEDELRAAIENGISGFCGISLPGPRWKACADSVESYVRPVLDKRDAEIERLRKRLEKCKSICGGPAYVLVSAGDIDHTEELVEGSVLIDRTKDGSVIGIEFLTEVEWTA